jgi:RNA recognition motif-containing protein
MFTLGSKIYVGNLPFSASEDELRELFEEHGPVESIAIITDRETGRPRGFGFVQMETSEGATSAIRALDGKPFGGRPLRVSEAQERDRGGDRGPRRDSGGGGGRGRPRAY